MKAMKLIPAVAFAAVLFASCDGNDPVTPRVLPYEFVNKVVYMNPEGADKAFADAKFVSYQMAGSDDTTMYYFEDSTKMSNYLTYMAASTVTPAQLASLGNVFLYTVDGEQTMAAYVNYSETMSSAKTGLSVVSRWANEKIFDDKQWIGYMVGTAGSAFAYCEGSDIADSIQTQCLGDHSAYLKQITEMGDSLQMVQEMGTVKSDGTLDAYSIQYYVMDGTYGVMFMRGVGGEATEIGFAPKKKVRLF